MTDLLALSSKVVDEGADDGSNGPINRINHELSEIADDIAMVEAFSHSVVFRTDAGLVTFDTSGAQGGKRVVDAIRGWSDEPEFVIHNIWRLYGGWWYGNPTNLKPAPDAALAQEMAALAGGAASMSKELSGQGEV